MGEFGFRPKRISLMSGKLTLDPDIIAMMSKLEADMATRRILADMLQPKWHLLLPSFQSLLSSPPPGLFCPPAPPSGVPTPYPNMSGPATPPRAGELSDVTGAITAPLGVPGLSGSARLQLPNSAAPSYEATITFDVMEFIKSR